LLWESAGFNETNEGNWRTISSAAVDNGIAVVSYGRGKFLAGIRLEGTGDITKSGRLWEHSDFGIDVPTPVVRDGKGILLDDRGKIVYFDMKSGEELWSADLPRNRYKYYASPVLAGDKLYCAREDGVIFAGRLTENGFEQLAENNMGEKVIATIVPVQNSLLIRGEKHLFRVGEATVKTASTANN
jgi:outer membrane protein assembly factor BamB